jgi:hypothetical protein
MVYAVFAGDYFPWQQLPLTQKLVSEGPETTNKYSGTFAMVYLLFDTGIKTTQTMYDCNFSQVISHTVQSLFNRRIVIVM